MNQRGFTLAAILLNLAILHSAAKADMMAKKTFLLDFTKPEEAKTKATWTTPDKFDYTKKGISRSGEGSVDFRVETTEAVPIGWSWRPVRSVVITAKVVPAGKFEFGENSIVYPHGEFYARYSPDGKHWSNWQHLQMQVPKNHEHPEQTYHGTLAVPYKESERYQKLVREYSEQDVPWRSDEEAAVKWILQKEPDFFEKGLPFVGYVQFLYETQLQGGHPLERIEVDLQYGSGGLHHPPKDRDAEKDRHGPWRFKADR